MVASLRPQAGLHYPRDWDEFNLWFPDDDACLDYLEWLRWPEGFVCPKCGSDRGWKTQDGRWMCGGCDRRTSVRAGTVFERSKVPLTTWFAGAWYITNQKHGASALGVKRVIGVSYQTAWTMLHKFRTVMAHPGREKLRGIVEVDETFVGGMKPGGKRGRGAPGKALVIIGVETKPKPQKGYGRVRMEVIKAAEAVHLLGFIKRNVEQGATVITDGLISYKNLPNIGYVHKPINVKRSGKKAHELLPAVHRAASLLKRVLLGTHQGAVEHEHLQAYLDEFCFRWNRRHSRQRGMLFYRLMQLAVAAPPVTYDDIRKNLRMRDKRERAARSKMSPPAGGKPRQPRTPVQGQPWRETSPV